MIKKQHNEFIKIVFSYIITFIQTLVLSPVIFIFFAPFIMILIIVQDNISFELSTIIVQIFSFGKESFAESYLQELYFIYAIIFSFLIEIFSKIFKRKLIITLKLKMILANLSLIISYFIAIILFTIFYKFDLVVLFFLLFFSLIYASIVILISHFLSYIKKLF